MALVRNESRASLVTAKFPDVTPVIGDLDSTSQITSEASEADVVLSMTLSRSSHSDELADGAERPGKLQSSSQRPSHRARLNRKQTPKARYRTALHLIPPSAASPNNPKSGSKYPGRAS